MSRDKEQNLKVVTAGIKVLERMANKGKGAKSEDEYRLVQVRRYTSLRADITLISMFVIRDLFFTSEVRMQSFMSHHPPVLRTIRTA